jgi:phosphohistidine phosphatase
VADKERPLKGRGKTDAKLISGIFKKNEFKPDMVFSSPANRAHSTCKIFLENLEISYKKLLIIDQLYDFGGQNVMNFVKSLDDSLENVMLFGHNHAFTSIVNLLGSKYIDNLPTSGLAKINFDINSWKEVQSGTTELLLLPSDFR